MVETQPIKTTFSVTEIQESLPHRYPFALIDASLTMYLKKAVGIKNVKLMNLSSRTYTN